MVRKHSSICREARGFTLIEVLIAVAVTAMLTVTIKLTVGLNSSLSSMVNRPQPTQALQELIDNAIQNSSPSQREALVGTPATDNPFSDPEDTPNRRLLSISTLDLGSGDERTTVIILTASSSSLQLSRWLDPSY